MSNDMIKKISLLTPNTDQLQFVCSFCVLTRPIMQTVITSATVFHGRV